MLNSYFNFDFPNPAMYIRPIKQTLIMNIRLHFTLLAILFCFIHLNAQFSTPGTGVNWTLDDLVSNSNGAVIQPALIYRIHENILISVNDTLQITEDAEIVFDKEVLFTVEGTLIVDPPNEVYIGPMFSGDGYPGLRLEEGSSILMRKIRMQEAGGIKCLTADFVMDSCQIINFNTRQNTGGALEFSRGKPIVTNTLFERNRRAAISSAANAHVAPIIAHNRFLQNSMDNTNRPQINMGPSGPADTTVISDNIVIGEFDMAGGIAFSSLLGDPANVLILNNDISNNRYGIAVTGTNISSKIIGNKLLDNNIQNLPLLGGSGININTSASGYNFAYIESNEIRGNLWGITLQGNAIANLGDTTSTNFNPGNNSFSNNGNEGQIHALFNNTPNSIPAMNNCWIENEDYNLAEAENVISHRQDDPALGLVNFEPFLNCSSVSTFDQSVFQNIHIFPNPACDIIFAENIPSGAKISLRHISGKVIQILQYEGSDTFQIDVTDLQAGMYLLEFKLNTSVLVKKQFVIK